MMIALAKKLVTGVACAVENTVKMYTTRPWFVNPSLHIGQIRSERSACLFSPDRDLYFLTVTLRKPAA